MKVSFDKSFHRGLLKITNKTILSRIKNIIIVAEAVDTLNEIPHLKKMEGFKAFYRIRIGDYRIGLELKKDTLHFLIVANRKDIYKGFP